MSEDVLNDLRPYGPVPSNFELTIAIAGWARMKGIAALGSADVSTTVDASGADAVRPASISDGGPFTLSSRSNEKTTSADESGEPSENTTCGRSLNVNLRASSDDEYERASDGTGADRTPRPNVSR